MQPKDEQIQPKNSSKKASSGSPIEMIQVLVKDSDKTQVKDDKLKEIVDTNDLIKVDRKRVEITLLNYIGVNWMTDLLIQGIKKTLTQQVIVDLYRIYMIYQIITNQNS
jgi:hypothetical protein